MPPERANGNDAVFFVDRSLGGKLVIEALRAAGAHAIGLDEVFPDTAPDTEWLERAGQEGWIVLTKDGAIRRNPHEKAMFQQARVRVFLLARQNLSGQEMADIFVAALPGMRKRAAEVEPPFIFSLSRSGSFSRIA